MASEINDESISGGGSSSGNGNSTRFIARYFRWDAKQPIDIISQEARSVYYDAYETENIPTAGRSVGKNASNEGNIILGSDYTTRSYKGLVGNLQAIYSCKDMPNPNEMYWYVVNGNIHWDNSTPWSPDNGMTEYTGGAWIRKKQSILSLGLQFDSEKVANGTDYRTVNYTTSQTVAATVANVNIANKGVPGNTDDYFFLPAMGGHGGVNGISPYYSVGACVVAWSTVNTGYAYSGSQYYEAPCNLEINSSRAVVMFHFQRQSGYGLMAEPTWFK